MTFHFPVPETRGDSYCVLSCCFLFLFEISSRDIVKPDNKVERLYPAIVVPRPLSHELWIIPIQKADA